MTKIRTIYSLKELHDLLEKHDQKHNVMVWFDFDLTIVKPHDEDEDFDVLIETEVTKDLFSYLLEHNIYFTIVTARFYDIVCNAKKRDLKAIEDNITRYIFPILEEIGLDISLYKNKNLDDQFHLIKSEKGRCVGLLYKGIIFGANKGQIIKNFRREFGFDKSRPTTIFIDDYDPYLNSVVRHVPDAIILKRLIK